MATRHGTATVTLPSDTKILITRTFEAPRSLVWEAMTTPRHLIRWWGPSWHPMIACDIDLRPGGSWRYTSRGTDGTELSWSGVFREIIPPQRLVTTEIFEPFPEAEALNTTTLFEVDGKTTVQILLQHQNQQYRDGHVAAGMEEGLQNTHNRLDDLLARADTASERFRRVAGRFGDRVAEVPVHAWQNPSPCEGWSAHDVVVHLLTWVPSLLERAGLQFPDMPHDQPVEAWRRFTETIQTALDDPTIAQRPLDTGPTGSMALELAVDRLVTGDILLHTWDLARAVGLDDQLDEVIAAQMLAGLEPMDEALRASGHYGPAVEVPEDANIQTRLVAFTGRQPSADPMKPSGS